MAAVHAVFSIHLRADQIVSGTAINILAVGITSFAYRTIYGSEGTPDVSRIPEVHIPGLADVPYLGEVFGDLNLMIWLILILIVIGLLAYGIDRLLFLFQRGLFPHRVVED